MNNTHMRKYNKIAFSTGGIKGISFIGCIKALEELNLVNNFKFFGGSSVGSLIALLLSIDYRSDEMFTTLKKVNLNSLRELKITNILQTYGISDTNRLGSLVKFCLMEKGLSPALTFKQLFDIKKNVLVITGTNINSRESVYFNYRDTPNMLITDALKISMCIPFFFNAVNLNENIYVDGGLMDPLPSEYIKSFNDEKNEISAKFDNVDDNENDTICENNIDNESDDSNENCNKSKYKDECLNVLAFNINNSLLKRCNKIEDIETFAVSITACVLQKMNSLMKLQKDKCIDQIDIDTNDFSAIDFNIKENDILSLVDLGYKQTKKWFEENEN